MPAVNASQHRLMCMALAVKEGKLSADKFPQAAKTASGMTLKQLLDY